MNDVEFEQQVAAISKARGALRVTAGHLIDCSRCANSSTSEEVDATDARDDFYRMGWRAKDSRQFCPLCA